MWESSVFQAGRLHDNSAPFRWIKQWENTTKQSLGRVDLGAEGAASWPIRCKQEIEDSLEQLQSGPEKSPTPAVDLFPVLCVALSFSKIFMLFKKTKNETKAPLQKRQGPEGKMEGWKGNQKREQGGVTTVEVHAFVWSGSCCCVRWTHTDRKGKCAPVILFPYPFASFSTNSGSSHISRSLSDPLSPFHWQHCPTLLHVWRGPTVKDTEAAWLTVPKKESVGHVPA